MTINTVDELIASLGVRHRPSSDLCRLVELLATIDRGCERMWATRAEEPTVRAALIVEEFAKIVEAKWRFDTTIAAQL